MTQTKRSYAAAFRALTAALLAAEDQILGKDRAWQLTNKPQARFLDEVLPLTRSEARMVPETCQKVAWDAGDINAFLLENGIDIRLEPLGADTFAFASVMKIRCPWEVPGTRKRILIPGEGAFPGVRLEQELTPRGESVTFSRSRHFESPIATLRTRTQDLVHITKFDEDMDAFDLTSLSNKIIVEKSENLTDFGAVHFPMVDLDVCPDVNWLMGMWTETTSAGTGTLVQALQQCRLQMNHKGAVVKDGFAGAVCLESMRAPARRPDLVIDGSFLFVLERPSLSLPIISLVVRPDSFGDPGELNLEDESA